MLVAAFALAACGTTQAEQRAVGFVGAATVTATDPPSASPSPTIAPTIVPTVAPTPVATAVPTIISTLVPTIAPTPVPTVARTVAPFVTPTPAPTLAQQPPQLLSLGVSATSVVAGGSIVFSAHVTDPGGSGVTMVVVMFNGSDGQTQTAYAYLHLASGTNLDGTWQTPIPVPAASAPGTWTMRGFYMQNAAGNADGRLPTALASQASFTVTH